MNSIKPRFKKLILDQTKIDQINSYLEIAKQNLVEHAKPDCEKFIDDILKQLNKQKFKQKKDL